MQKYIMMGFFMLFIGIFIIFIKHNNFTKKVFNIINLRLYLIMISFIRIFVIVFLSISFLIIIDQLGSEQISGQILSHHTSAQPVRNSCTKYDSNQRLIIVSCKSATLTDISNKINNYGILDKQPNGVWVLNANLTINPDLP